VTERNVKSFSFSGDGIRFAAVVKSAIFVWDTTSFKEVVVGKGLVPDESKFDLIQVSRDGSMIALATNSDITIFLVQAGCGQEVGGLTIMRTIKAGCTVTALARSPSFQHLASLDDNREELRIWEVETGELSAIYKANWEIYPIAFSASGRHIAAVTRNQFVHILPWPTDKEVPEQKQILKGPRRSIYSLSFSPKALVLAGARDTGNISLWRYQDQSQSARTQTSSNS
jgi:WD40 repeat protein